DARAQAQAAGIPDGEASRPRPQHPHRRRVPRRAVRPLPASGARARFLQRRSRRGLRMAQGAGIVAARRLRRGDPARRDARIREAVPAQLRRVPVPLLERPDAGAGPDAGRALAVAAPEVRLWGYALDLYSTDPRWRRARATGSRPAACGGSAATIRGRGAPPSTPAASR